MECRCVLAREQRGTFLAVYIAKVRITVKADGLIIIREGHGTGEGRGSMPGEVHDIALKAAETDATKRALATFGRPFGLALYRHGKLARRSSSDETRLKVADQRMANRVPDTTVILHPPPAEGAGQHRPDLTSDKAAPETTTPAAPAGLASDIDESMLTLGKPKRLRDKAHLLRSAPPSLRPAQSAGIESQR